MKAWRAWPDGEEWSVLIYAPTRGRARYLLIHKGALSKWDIDWNDARATREPKWDGLMKTECVIDSADDLPPGAPDGFWTDGDEPDA